LTVAGCFDALAEIQDYQTGIVFANIDINIENSIIPLTCIQDKYFQALLHALRSLNRLYGAKMMEHYTVHKN